MKHYVVSIVLGTWLVGYALSGPVTGDTADTIYHGGDIVTVDDAQPTAEAVAVKDGRILAVGAESDVMAYRGEATRVVDLAGRTMTPAFTDPHGHFIFALQQVKQANLSSPPVGPVETIDDAIAALEAFKQEHQIADGEFLVGYGYDPNQLRERRDVTREDLDPHFPDNPVILIHVSGHGAVLNSAAFDYFGIDAGTETPPGGIIARLPGGNEPAGQLMETAYIPVMSSLPQPSEQDLLDTFEPAFGLYA